jgi:hypothetical protein
VVCRRKLFLIVVIVLTGVVSSASAIDWTGLGGNDSWCTPENWQGNTVPGEYDWAYIDPVTPRDPVIDCDVNVGYVQGPRYASNDDQSLDIETGTIVFQGWRFGTSGGGSAIINMTGGTLTVQERAGENWAIRAADSGIVIWNQSGGSVTCPDSRMRVGDNGGTYTEFNISGDAGLSMYGEWKWGDEGDVVLNMNGGSIDIGTDWRMNCRDFSNTDVNMTGGNIWVGGNIRAADSSDNTQVATINLSDGTIEAESLLLPAQDEGTGILNMTGGAFTCRNTLRVPNAAGGTGIINLDGGTVSTASFYIGEGGILDINDGILLINGNVVNEVLDDVNGGYITAYNGDGAVVVDYNSVTYKTIVSAGPAVAFETSASAGLESESPAILTVVLYDPPEANTVTVDYAATDGTAVGGGQDYTLNPGTLTFNPGQTSQTIEISIIDDGSDEEDETVEVTLFNPVNAELGTPSRHTYTILDPRPTVAFDTVSSSSRENISPAYIPVGLSHNWPQTVTVDYTVIGGTAVGGGEDYNLPAGTLQFDPCDVTEHISINVVEDALDEFPDETIEIILSNPGNARLGSNTQHTFTILPPPVRLCPEGDLDGDCDVDSNDLEIFVGQWLDPPGSCWDFNCADFDNTGGVDGQDYAIFAQNWCIKDWPLVINEFMASDANTLEDPCEPNEFPDWFELYNASPIPLDLEGMYLTDDLTNPTRWRIPAGVTIDAGGFLVFFADDDDEQGPTHTNFKLSASGEEIGLFDADGSTLIHSISFGRQTTDVSYGLYPDASDHEQFFAIPTPGWENCGAYLGVVADTKFSHDRGFYESAFNLSITCDTPDANIYYTLDGSEPDESAATLYTGPITGIDHTTVLRAAAFKAGYMPSNVDTQTYIFLDDVVEQSYLDPYTVAVYGPNAVKDALKLIPTFSIVMNQSDFNNLQVQDSRAQGDDPQAKKELPTSVELIYPDPNQGQGFQITCGIEGHSWPENDTNPNQKRSYRLLFKSEFGPARLTYPFFESAPLHVDSAVEQFDRIILRSGKNQSWTSGRFEDLVTYVEDQWVRDSQITVSDVGSHGTFVHLYVNGDYWGLFNPVERPDAWFASAHFGGEMEDYFAANSNEDYPYYDHLSGDNTRFNRMVDLAVDKDLEDPNKLDEFKQLLDIEEFVDYVILFWYCGFGDGVENNWYGGMRNEPEGPFMYYMWDGEFIFLNTAGPAGHVSAWVPPYFFDSALDHQTMIKMWQGLFELEDFRMLFADRVYKHCFNDGALTDENSRSRLAALSGYIYDPIIGESVRWGGGRTRDIEWLSAVALLDSKMAGNVDIFINALRDWSSFDWPGAILYPDIDPPTMTPRGGYDPTGFSVTMTGSSTIYYSLDGSDPREAVTGSPVGTVYTGPIMLDKTTHLKARVFDDPNWSALNEAIFAIGPVADELRITEIMYHPQDAGNPNDPNAEFIELKNIGASTLNLNLVSFTNGVGLTFPADMSIPAGGYVVVVKDQSVFQARYSVNPNIIAGQYTGSLNNAGERIELQDALGRTILNFRYEDGWREITDGDGFSLTITDPNNVDPNSWGRKDSWRASAYIDGSPGWDDSGIVPNPGAVVINELLAHSDGYPNDWIELHNTTAEEVDISDWFLSDNDSDLMKYQIHNPTTIPAGGYIVFTQDDHFGNLSDPGSRVPFGLSENGEDVYLSSALDSNGVLTGYRQVEDFGASQNGVSFGRYYKGSTGNFNFVAMDHITPGFANAYPKVGPMVINKIMYHPDWPDLSLYNNDEFEYIELCNISDSNVTLYDYGRSEPWKFTDGIEFAFPAAPPITIPAGGYLLVVKDPEAFTWRYPGVPAQKILGPYDGRLNNRGEKVEISMPGDVDGSGELHYIHIDRINYSDGLHPEDCPGDIDLWPTEADGAGASLSRLSLQDYGNDPNNWQPSTCVPEYGLQDLAYLIGLIEQYPSYYVGPTDPNFDACFDLSSWQVGVPDEWLGPEDVAYLDNRISNVPSY